MELDVLAIGDVGGAAGEVVGDRAQYAKLLAAQAPTVQTHPLQEVAVGELGGIQPGRAAAVDSLLALGVQTPPAETAVEVVGCDGLVAAWAVDVHDPVAYRQRSPVLLEGLVVIERLAPVEGPLAVRPGLARRAHGADRWRDGGGHCSSMTVVCHWHMRSVRGGLVRCFIQSLQSRSVGVSRLNGAFRTLHCAGYLVAGFEVPVVSGAGQARQHMTA